MDKKKHPSDKKEKVTGKNEAPEKPSDKETDKFSPGEPDNYNAEEFSTD